MANNDGHEESALATNEDVGHSGSSEGLAVPAMSVTGLAVTKADLVAALRIYVPLLADIAPLAGDWFILSMAPIIKTEDIE